MRDWRCRAGGCCGEGGVSLARISGGRDLASRTWRLAARLLVTIAMNIQAFLTASALVVPVTTATAATTTTSARPTLLLSAEVRDAQGKQVHDFLLASTPGTRVSASAGRDAAGNGVQLAVRHHGEAGGRVRLALDVRRMVGDRAEVGHHRVTLRRGGTWIIDGSGDDPLTICVRVR